MFILGVNCFAHDTAAALLLDGVPVAFIEEERFNREKHTKAFPDAAIDHVVELARPGNLVTWAVDRARASSWLGDDRMQAVKAVSFTALDAFRATFAAGSTESQVKEELGLSSDAGASTTYADPETSWLPAIAYTSNVAPLAGCLAMKTWVFVR